MKKNIKFISLAFIICVIVLEALPYGVVLNFSNGSESFKETFSYFDLLPFGYADFFPLITAVLSILLLILTIVFTIKANKKIIYYIEILNIVSVITSIMCIIFGLTWIGILIIVFLSLNLIIIYQIKVKF